MAGKTAQNPLILHYHRLMDAFAKSNDERDFYLDRQEGFMVFVDLDKSHEEIEALEEEVKNNSKRYCLLPKLTFYETKKLMENFVNEKVFDIDTKEKLMDIIQSKEAREHFLEFIYDHHTELEKWQQFYQERFRIRIIEWLRNEEFRFVFEEDLDLQKNIVEKLKQSLFDAKVPKDLQAGRKALEAKSKTYYSNEALNPRPKRGRPPKQVAKVEMETKITADIYTTIPPPVRPFLYNPEINNASCVTFSSKFENEEELLKSLKGNAAMQSNAKLQALSNKLQSLKELSEKIPEEKLVKMPRFDDWSMDDDDDDAPETKAEPKSSTKAKKASKEKSSKKASLKKLKTISKKK